MRICIHGYQGRSQDSVNGGAQLSAVTRPYISCNIIVISAQVILGPSEERHLGGFGGWILDFLGWFLMHFINKKEPANA